MDIKKQSSDILIYQTADGKTKIETRLEDETVWLTQAQICELFQKSKATISEHIKHIFEEAELDEDSVVRNFRTTAADGKEYDTNYYNLDVIISVGYRVKSLQGTKFRQWATARLKEVHKNELSQVERHFIKQLETSTQRLVSGKKKKE